MLILLLGAALQAAAWFGLAPDRTSQAFATWAIVPLTAILLLVWWSVFSGLTWKRKLLGFALLAVAIGLGRCVIRVDGYTGEMFPILALRWHETAQQRAENYWATSPRSPAPPRRAAKKSTSKAIARAEADDWTEFRGPKRDGVVRGVTLTHDWSQGSPPLAWKHPVGAGWSSFAVSGGQAFTQEQRAEEEAVVCYDLETGREVWACRNQGHFVADPAGEGPRATPTVFKGRVYAQGATGILNCLDQATGERIWSHDILEEHGAKNLPWGLAASPLVYDDFVVVNPGGPRGAGVVAYHRVTGEQLWSAGKDVASYASPQLARLHGKWVVLIFDGAGLGGHDAATGRELWKKFAWTNTPQINVAQPIVLDEHRVFISSGYGTGSALVKVTATGDRWSAEPLWTTRDLKLKFNGAVARDGFVYGLDEGILSCLDLATGTRRWKQGRYGFGQMLLVGDLLLIQSESGEVVLVEATPNGPHELGRFPGVEYKSWNCPVLCRGRLLLRNGAEAACFDMTGIVSVATAAGKP